MKCSRCHNRACVAVIDAETGEEHLCASCLMADPEHEEAAELLAEINKARADLSH